MRLCCEKAGSESVSVGCERGTHKLTGTHWDGPQPSSGAAALTALQLWMGTRNSSACTEFTSERDLLCVTSFFSGTDFGWEVPWKFMVLPEGAMFRLLNYF